MLVALHLISADHHCKMDKVLIRKKPWLVTLEILLSDILMNKVCIIVEGMGKWGFGWFLELCDGFLCRALRWGRGVADSGSRGCKGDVLLSWIYLTHLDYISALFLITDQGLMQAIK